MTSVTLDQVVNDNFPRSTTLLTMATPAEILNSAGDLLVDPRFMGSMCVAYLVFVKWLGPKMMAARKPYDLKYFIVAYNALQVVWNFYALTIPFRYPRSWTSFIANCVLDERVTFSSRDWPEYHIAWCYYISKFIDMLDTVFFVLRKKDKQISFLHVYHHTLIVPSSWYFVTHVREPVYIPYTMINTTVHCIMYFYYMIAALGPQYNKYVWWKIYITRFQMIQFITVIILLSSQLAYGCNMTSGWAYYLLANNLLLIGLFGNFYLRAYRREKKKVA